MAHTSGGVIPASCGKGKGKWAVNCDAPAKRESSPPLSLICPHELPMAKNMAAHGLFQQLARGDACLHVKKRIQSVKLEIIAVRLARRRIGTAVTDGI